jgi:hypothetical protein
MGPRAGLDWYGGEKISCLHHFRTPDPSTRSDSVYRLCCVCLNMNVVLTLISVRVVPPPPQPRFLLVYSYLVEDILVTHSHLLMGVGCCMTKV